jgi:DNA repair exonuclease SbcCD ATPase subunit
VATNPAPNGPTETDPGTPAGPATGTAVTPEGTVTVQDPPKQPEQQSQAGQESRFTAADLERVRQEEKDKLYGRLSKVDERSEALEAELKELREERQAREAEEAQRQQSEADEAKQKAEAEMSAKKLLQERSSEWEKRFEQIEREREQERAALAKESEYNRLRAYIQERAGAERDSIAPELVDLIAGNSPEEVDASIEMLKDKTQAIFQSVQSAQETARSQMRGVAATGYTGNGPTDGDGGSRQLSADDIKNMPMAEFAKYRNQLLGAAAQKTNNRGLFD